MMKKYIVPATTVYNVDCKHALMAGSELTIDESQTTDKAYSKRKHGNNNEWEDEWDDEESGADNGVTF